MRAFTCDDLERSNQGHVTFNSLHLGNGAGVRHMVLIVYGKSHESNSFVILDL
jgi:hypothetical protein